MVLSLEKIWWLVDQFELPLDTDFQFLTCRFFLCLFLRKKSEKVASKYEKKSSPDHTARTMSKIIGLIFPIFSHSLHAVASKLLQFGVFFTQIELYESHRPGPTSSDSDLDTSDDEEFAGVSALATAFNIAKGRKFLTIFFEMAERVKKKGILNS